MRERIKLENIPDSLDCKEHLTDVKNRILKYAQKAVENVSQLRDAIKEAGVETLKTKFEHAYSSVCELKDKLKEETFFEG